MLILNFMILVTEIISTFTIVREYSDIVLFIWMKIHWLFTIAWFYFIALYDLILINDVEADSFKTFFKENAKVRNITYLTIVALIVFFILIATRLSKVTHPQKIMILKRNTAQCT